MRWKRSSPRIRLRPILRPLLVTLGILVLLGGVEILILWLNGLISFGRASEFLAAVSLCRDGARGAAISRSQGHGSRPTFRVIAFDSARHPSVWDLPCPESPLTAIAGCSLSERIFVGCEDGSLLLYEMPDGQTPPVIVGRHASSSGFGPVVERIVLSDDERLLATVGGYNVILWDVDHRRERRVDPDGKWQTCAAFLGPGSLLTGTTDGEILLWCTATGRQLQRLATHAAAIDSVAVSPTGTLMAATGADQMVHVWDVETGTKLWSHNLSWPFSNRTAFSTDGGTLAVSDLLEVSIIQTFDAATGASLRVLKTGSARINALITAQDGSFFASDNEGTTWNWDGGDEVTAWQFGTFTSSIDGF